MNRNALYLAVFAVLCVLAGVLVGAYIAGPKWQRHRGDRQDFRDRADRFMGYKSDDRTGRKGSSLVDMFASKLSLSDEQKTKVSAILENTRKEISEAGKSFRASMNTIREKGDQEILAILTPEQQAKFKVLQKEFEKNRGSMRGGRGHRQFQGDRSTPGADVVQPQQ